MTHSADYFFTIGPLRGRNLQYDVHPPGGKVRFAPPFGVLWGTLSFFRSGPFIDQPELVNEFPVVLRVFPNKLSGPIAGSIAVKDAVENRGLYRVFVSRLFRACFRRVFDTVAPQSRC